jgi:hypothetical protein
MWRSDDRGENWTNLAGPLGNAPLIGGAVSFGSVDSLYAVASPHGDGYLAKLDPTGAVVFSTLIGGRNADKVQSVVVAQNGDILIAGTTQSDDLLTFAGAPLRTAGGFEQGFLARISSDGSTLLAFRYVGGTNTDSINGMAMLSSGELAVLGATASPDEPDVTPDAWQSQIRGPFDDFLAVFSATDLTTRFYSFLGTSSFAHLATAGMKAYLTASTIDGQFEGTTLHCDSSVALFCDEIYVGVDLTP